MNAFSTQFAGSLTKLSSWLHKIYFPYSHIHYIYFISSSIKWRIAYPGGCPGSMPSWNNYLCCSICLLKIFVECLLSSSHPECFLVFQNLLKVISREDLKVCLPAHPPPKKKNWNPSILRPDPLHFAVIWLSTDYVPLCVLSVKTLAWRIILFSRDFPGTCQIMVFCLLKEAMTAGFNILTFSAPLQLWELNGICAIPVLQPGCA